MISLGVGGNPRGTGKSRPLIHQSDYEQELSLRFLRGKKGTLTSLVHRIAMKAKWLGSQNLELHGASCEDPT